ncbi:hypothetical protein G5C60_07890 [Streptomyces sp. HC44]|uniref:Uncharacterized protein n=1 Tax=Streptomyces scabichelini TaxID=2711217 RepID=A0A6G4V145_9ACTN|nr:hypothetical protein [Streptomyces scabichelini]NGO07574.1 hypothetical protein [Streptomyces scabichelini]
MTESVFHKWRAATVLAAAAAAVVGVGLVASPASAATSWESLTVPITTQKVSVLPVSGQNLFARSESICFDASECTPTVRLWQKTGTTYKELTPPAEAAVDTMAGTATDDLWVIGTRWASNGSNRIHHYNGSTWSANLNPDPKSLELYDAEAVGRNSVWGAGSVRVAGAPTKWVPAVSHWDGQSWKTTKFADMEGNLVALDVRNENDIWAVGHGDDQPLAMHYDGTTWREVPLTGTSNMDSLREVFSNGPNDVWINSGEQMSHWDGKTWTRHDISAAPQAAVSFSSYGGQVYVGVRSFGSHPKLNRWTGTAWQADTSLTKGNTVDQLATGSDGSLYAASSQGDGVVFRYNAYLSRLAPPTTG